MRKNTKTILFSLSLIAIGTSVTVAALSGSDFDVLFASGCQHKHVEHHSAIEPSLTTIGQSEYWCCCDCHVSFKNSALTEEFSNTQGNPTDVNDGRYISPLGKEITANITNGTISSEVAPLNAFLRVYEKSDGYAQSIFKSNVDISNFDKVTFVFKSTSLWYSIDSWKTANFESQNWKLFELVQKDTNVWDIYVSNIGGTPTLRVSDRSGSDLKSVLDMSGDTDTYYMTNIRGIKKGERINTDRIAFSSVASYEVLPNEDAPSGYETVTRSSVTYTSNNQGKTFLADLDISSYNKVSFAFRTENRRLCEYPSWGGVLTTEDWYICEITKNDDDTFNSQVLSMDGTVKFGYQNIASFKDALIYCNWDGDNPNCVYYSTEVRGSNLTKPTDVVLATGKNIDSGYKIVYQDNGDKNISKAAEDLFYYLGLASNWSLYLPPEADSGQTYDPNTKIISIGNTAFYNGSGLNVSSKLGESGFSVNTRGNALLINAYAGPGFNPAIQYVLNKTIGYNAYSFVNTEKTYNVSSSIPLMNFKSTIIPTIGYREIVTNPDVLQGAQKMYLGYNYDMSGYYTLNQYHSMGDNLLSYSSFKTSHPNWYYTNNNETQVCYSAHGNQSEYTAMKNELVSEIESLLTNSEYAQNTINLSIMDNWKVCDCDACQSEQTTYGGYAGQQLHFFSSVADTVEAWIQSTCPDKSVRYVMLAYQQCQDAPTAVNYNLNKNIIVQYAPVQADFSKQFSQSENATYYNQLVGWSNLLKNQGMENNLWMWTYSQSVECYMLPSNEFEASAGQYKTFSDLGVSKIQVEFPYYTRAGSFEDLNIYLKGKLMSYADYDYESLVTDFMSHYYGEAATNMKAYYDLLKTTIQNSGVGGSIWDNADSEDIFTKDIVKNMITLLDNCLNDVSSIEDEERKAELESRIHRERCTPIYLLMEHYLSSHTYSKSVMKEYLNEFSTYTTKYGMNKIAHDITTESKISSYTTKVNLLLY